MGKNGYYIHAHTTCPLAKHFPIPGDLFFVVLEIPNFIVFPTNVAHAKSRS
jgi:hypothetical protein